MEEPHAAVDSKTTDGSARVAGAVVLTPSRTVEALTFGAALAVVAVGAVVVAMNPASAATAILPIGILVTLAAFGARQAGWMTRASTCDVWFDQSGLHERTKLVLPASAIRAVQVQRRTITEGGRIILKRAWYQVPVFVDTLDYADAWNLLETAAHGQLRRVSVYSLWAMWDVPIAYVLSYAIAYLLSGGGTLRFVFAALLLFALATMGFKRTLWVGSDGVRFRRFWREQFIAFGELSSVETVGRSIRVDLKSGRKIVLGRADGAEGSAALVALKRAFERYRSHAPPHDTEFALLDSGRPYQQVAHPADKLWDLLDNPVAPPRMRARAALILTRESCEAAARIRMVASDTASPPLRLALEAAAELNEEAVESALDPRATRRA